MVDPTILETIRRYFAILADNGIPVVKGNLFGSFARGEQTEDSDIDLLVISPLFDHAKESVMLDTLWRARRHADIRIEPFAVGVVSSRKTKIGPSSKWPARYAVIQLCGATLRLGRDQVVSPTIDIGHSGHSHLGSGLVIPA